MKCLRAPFGAVWLFVLSNGVRAEYQLNLPTPQSSIARTVYDLHTILLWVCLAIFVVVFGAMFYALFKHRKSLGHEAHPFHESTTVEVIWTVIPFLILIGIAWPATQAVLAQKDTSNPDLTVKVTGHQWKWEYDYLQEGVKFMSVLATPREQIDNQATKGEHYLLEVDEPLVVPAGKKVRVLLTAADVIHAWWVPALGVKQDAIPGFIRDTWFKVDQPGTYRGQCAELCGVGHGFMPVVVNVVAPEEFAVWKDEQKTRVAAAAANASKTYELAELRAMGEKVYGTYCTACHQENGMGLPGAFPALNKSPMVTGDKAAHIDMVLNGKDKTAMAAFGALLSDVDIAAVVTFERNHWDNQTGDVVQPADIAARR